MLSEQSIVTSTSNATVKMIRALRSRKGREQTGNFWVEGIRLVGVAAEQQAPIELLVLAPELLTSSFALGLAAKLQEQDVPVLAVSAGVFAKLSAKDGPQGIGAVVRQNWQALPNQLGPNEIRVALAAVQDPGNLGSIMRTAAAVGSTGLILIGNCTDPYSPGAVRGSMGSIFGLQLTKITENDFLHWHNKQQLMLVGTSGAAEHGYRQIHYKLPLVLLSGSERQGLSQPLAAACDHLVSIPMPGAVDSLNLAVATSIVLYEVFEQTIGR